MLQRWTQLPENQFPGTREDWLLKPAKELDCTCQQQPVLGNPLNWLEQIVLEGQTSTAGAHLKETPKISNDSVVVKGSRKKNKIKKKSYLQTTTNYIRYLIFNRCDYHSVKCCTTEQVFPCVED